WETFCRSELYEVTHGQLNVAKLQTAVDPALCAADDSCPKDASGDPTLDIFGRGPKTAEEISYTTFDDQERTDYQMMHLAATITGDIFEMPAGNAALAAGIEYREEEGGVQTSGVVQAGDSGGNFAEPTEGDYDVSELYAEFAFPLMERLNLDVATRYSDYSTFGSETTYKVSLGWVPIDSLRIRGVVSTGYRAPNILELFGGVADTFLTVSDPCIASAQAADPNRQANCAADGVPATFVQPAAQLKISAGGNPLLDAETSDNFTVGVVWQPSFTDLRVAVDWYDVEIEEAVGTPDPVSVITTCYDSPGGSLSAPECNRIGRGPDGSVVRFELLNENLATVETSGVDLDATWAMETDMGRLQFDWLVNWLNEYVETTGTGVVSDRTGQVAGLVSSWAAYPEWRSNFKATLTRNNWSLSLGWRYLDEMDVFDVIEFDNIHTTADAQHYFDIDGHYDLGAWRLAAGVENFTNEEPPYVTDVSANTSGIYDFLGRFYYVRVSVGWQ
ncbi:MAG: TonB-dependent receptor, partial [Pseudomonadales bacterium]|nr:TonB-dependent receptor [Pseudomonadales bacterium]